jgi:hypothetical protein
MRVKAGDFFFQRALADRFVNGAQGLEGGDVHEFAASESWQLTESWRFAKVCEWLCLLIQ